MINGLDIAYNGGEFDYSEFVVFTTSNKSELFDRIKDIKHKNLYCIEIYTGNEDGEFIEGDGFDDLENFIANLDNR